MRQESGSILFSATDLVNFLGCSHSIALDIEHTREGGLRGAEDPYVALLRAKGNEHEREYLRSLKGNDQRIAEINSTLPLRVQVEHTRKAMGEGIPVIYQGALFGAPWHGYSDFLVRRDGVESSFGDYAYEVIDTKLSLSARPKHVVQLAVYSRLVAAEQNAAPHQMHIVLGDRTKVSLNVSEFAHYCEIARGRLESFVNLANRDTTAEPCGHCAFCRWAERCDDEWERLNHLSRVANISRSQILKLRAEGVATLNELAALTADCRIPKMQAETLVRLRSQAALQAPRRAGGPPAVEILPLCADRGFERMPKPDAADLFFDMEGDPLFSDGGLEYLFGFDHMDNQKVRFTAFWAHSRAEEKKAFQDAVDFIVSRMAKHPDAHVYHYASYEETALKRLAMLHGTREAEVDDLLRNKTLVDLYKVVREGIRTSEPAYSIKNLEVFYTTEREEAVKSGGDSIVIYERWRKVGDKQLLQDISDYNKFDCKSTRMCRDWLLTLRPDDAAWFGVSSGEEEEEEAEESPDEFRREREEAMLTLQESLIDGVSDEDLEWRELLGNLLEFHHREAKPAWWAMFDRMEKSVEDLIDDAECIGGLMPDSTKKCYTDARSMVHCFTFPPQDFKLRVGDRPRRAGTGKSVGTIIELDEDAHTIKLKAGPTVPEFETPLSLIPAGPIDDKVLRAAVYRYATAVAAGDEDSYAAVTGILRKSLPRLKGTKAQKPILPDDKNLLDGSVDAIGWMRDTHMLVQGPPGSGKTYTSSHAIVELLARGKRIAVSSNSHKAINNLLKDVEKVAAERKLVFKGAKKSSTSDQFFSGGGCIIDTKDARVAGESDIRLVAGTAWLFAKDLDNAFDYLFIDEAGQVSLANVVAMGLCAKNIVLVGDQMQLSQPMQGAHPGNSGESALEHLLENHATVPPEAGIFLAETWRLHPDVCQFISDAVYEGRLEPAKDNDRQALVLKKGTTLPSLAPSGIRFVDVTHIGNTQKSEEEAEAVRETYESLLKQSWVNRDGVKKSIGIQDILVVTPYNMQVNLLKSVLPPGARVGTVDKFQGQEAAVVLVSMATSSGDDINRNIEFLFSRNRLNVAISRARCLAVVFASPRLLEVTCKTIEQMRLVNTLCWVKTFADAQAKTRNRQTTKET